MRLIHEFKVHSLLLLFSRAFYVYLLLFRSLQYIYQSLYRSYPSVCLCTSQRQPEIPFSFYLDHANNLRLLIRFQHVHCLTRKIMSVHRQRSSVVTDNVADFFGNPSLPPPSIN